MCLLFLLQLPLEVHSSDSVGPVLLFCQVPVLAVACTLLVLLYICINFQQHIFDWTSVCSDTSTVPYSVYMRLQKWTRSVISLQRKKERKNYQVSLAR